VTTLVRDLVVAQNVVNLYAEPDSGSGLVSQAILGVSVECLKEHDDFCRVTMEDRYSGWTPRRAMSEDWDDSDHFKTHIASLFADVFHAPDPYAEIITKLVVGTRVVVAHRPEVGDWVPLHLPDGQIGYVHQVCLNATHSASADSVIQPGSNIGALKRQVLAAVGRQAAAVARRFIGTPYLWGGCTPFGLDCSGLTQLSYKLSGLQLLRDAGLQFNDRRFLRIEENQTLDTAILDEGDLVAFSKAQDGRITHIGLALGEGRFIHARGDQGVRIDDCDTAEYIATYVGAIRISPDADLAIEAA